MCVCRCEGPLFSNKHELFTDFYVFLFNLVDTSGFEMC